MADENTRPPITPPDYVAKEGERIMQALRDATPRRIDQGNLGPQVTVVAPSPLVEGKFGASGTDWTQQGKVTRRSRPDQFSTPASDPTVQQIADSIPNISFIVSDKSTSVGTPPVVTNKVLIADGKINGALPSGMGTGDYILTLATPTDSLIYAGVTFNPTTLAITSRFLGVSTAAAYPESRTESPTSGFLYWLLAFTFVTADGAFKVVNVRVGDIYVAFAYGAQDGAPALLPIPSEQGWLDLSFV